MSDALAFALSAAGLVGIIAGWLRWIRPRWRRAGREWQSAKDSLLGREAVVDSITGREVLPALPGVGVRLDTQERHLAAIEKALTTLAADSAQLANHEERIRALEVAAIERVAARAESVAAWRAVEAVAANEPSAERPDPPGIGETPPA